MDNGLLRNAAVTEALGIVKNTRNSVVKSG